MVIGRQRRAEPLCDQVGRADVAVVGIAAHDIGSAHDDRIAVCYRGFGGFERFREFGDGYALLTPFRALRCGLIVMATHFDAACGQLLCQLP